MREKNFNSVLNFRRVRHFRLCVLETQVMHGDSLRGEIGVSRKQRLFRDIFPVLQEVFRDIYSKTLADVYLEHIIVSPQLEQALT